MKYKKISIVMLSVLMLMTSAISLSDSGTADTRELVEILPTAIPLAFSPVTIPMPTASGVDVSRNARAEVDYSNIRYGYIMARIVDTSIPGARIIINGPTGTRYQYRLATNGSWEVFPLSDGNGAYSIGIFEQVVGNQFASSVSLNINVRLVDEFAPFLRPNQFVNFTNTSPAVQRARTLVQGSSSVIDAVTRIYTFVIDNIEYDFQLAETVQSGYVPNIDLVYSRRRGICFDYAALMTAMLRSQGVPTKLIIGYAGPMFHAWISVHSPETGWINNLIWFDGTNWSIMDPTFSSTSNGSDDFARFIGDGTNYNPLYFH